MSATARRTPVQDRSQKTVEKVLAATTALLARGIPVDILTTAQIAAEAAISVGALYRFFPDKQSIVDAIALSHMERFQDALGMRLMLAFPPDAPSFLSAIIDAFAEYIDGNPDFRTVAFGAPGTPGAASGATGRTISRRTRDTYAASGDLNAMVREFLAETYDVALTDTFELRLKLAIEIGDRLLAHCFEQPAESRPAVLGETKRILVATLFPGDAT